MDPKDMIAIFNIVAPHVFGTIRYMQDKNPSVPYKQILEQAGVVLDSEYQKLLEDMAIAVKEGAVPRTGSETTIDRQPSK